MADLRIVDTPLLSTVKGTEKIPTGGEGNFSVSVNQVADFAKLKWFLATEGYVDNTVGNVQADLNLHKNNESNPHNVTKTQVGLGNVDNTADLDKPVSNASIASLSLKADKITTYTKTEVDSEFYGIYQNGAALPHDATMEYAENAHVVKDGELQKKQGAGWVSVANKGYNLDYFVSGKSYPLHAEIMLTNGDIVKSTIPNNTANPNIDMTGWINETNELYIYRKPVIYASKLKTDGTDQLSSLNALAIEAVTKKLELVLPSGIITINNEFIPPDGLNMSSCTNFSGSDSANATTIKWGGVTGINKSVVRCSRKPIGVTPLEVEADQVSGVVIKGIKIDASDCDFGFYARNFTNESHAEILVQRAKKCGIWIGQCWFSTFGRLIATFNYDRGIVIGVPLAGETGDTDVNAIEFPYIRAHSNGRDLTYNQTTNIKGGCGIEINSRGCFYGQIQSEKNQGVGLIENSQYRQNQYAAVYLEENCKNVTTTERYGLINYGTSAMFESFTITRQQVVKNAVSNILYIKNFSCDTASDRAFSTSNVGKIALTGAVYGAFFGLSSAEYRSMFVLYNHKLMSVFANFKYSGTYTTQMFTTQQYIGYPHLVFTPTDTTTPVKSMIFQVDGNEVVINTSGAVKGSPISVRTPLMVAGLHTVQLMDAAGSTDCNGILEIVYSRLPNGQQGERLGS